MSVNLCIDGCSAYRKYKEIVVSLMNVNYPIPKTKKVTNDEIIQTQNKLHISVKLVPIQPMVFVA